MTASKWKSRHLNPVANAQDIYLFILLLLFFLSFVVVVAISWATPVAYGGSQARG